VAGAILFWIASAASLYTSLEIGIEFHVIRGDYARSILQIPRSRDLRGEDINLSHMADSVLSRCPLSVSVAILTTWPTLFHGFLSAPDSSMPRLRQGETEVRKTVAELLEMHGTGC
jgi:hypothetical protein